MTTEVLGSLSFLTTPQVNGLDTVLNVGGVPSLAAATLASRPAAGVPGRLFIDTTNNLLYRDNGSTWDTIGSSSSYTGTANQINVAGSVISLAANPIVPGTGGMVLPSGTTAQRGASTAGNVRYNSTLGYSEVYNGAVWQPFGRLLQRVSVNVPSTTGTNTFALGTTAPTTATMTSVIVTQSFTPLSATSTLSIRFSGTCGVVNNSRGVLLSVFSDSTHQVSGHTFCATSNMPYPVAMETSWQPGSTATISITMRGAVTNGSSTWSVGTAGSVTLGGAFSTDMIIEEYL